MLVLLIAADIGLRRVHLESGIGAKPRSKSWRLMMRNRDLLKTDIQRADEIRSHIPAIRKDCDAFEQSLFPESTGYSRVSADLGSLAAKSGLRLNSRALNPKAAVKGHHLTELKIDAQVTGDYRGVVRFLNGLQALRELLRRGGPRGPLCVSGARRPQRRVCR